MILKRKVRVRGVFGYLHHFDDERNVEAWSILLPVIYQSPSLHIAWAKTTGDWWTDEDHPHSFIWSGGLQTSSASGFSFHIGRLGVAIYRMKPSSQAKSA